MKKQVFVWILTITLLLTLQITIFAEEAQPFTLDPEELITEDSDSQGSAFFTGMDWAADSKTYRDQLALYCGDEHTAVMLYDGLSEVFWQDYSGSQRMTTASVTFSNSGEKTCWVTPVLLKNTWNVSKLGNTEAVQAALDEWQVEMRAAATLASAAFVADHPEYFWIRISGGMGVAILKDAAGKQIYVGADGDSYLDAVVYYNYVVQAGCDTLEERVALQNRIETVVERLTNKTENLTDAQKVAWWDNWLAANNQYNNSALADGYIYNDSTPWSVVGSLLDGYQPVCEGYAKALQLLCHEANIPCVQVTGQAKELHMWVAIKLGDDWYFCDPTWDDPGQDEESNEYSSRKYLLTCQPATHTPSDNTGLGLPIITAQNSLIPMSKSADWLFDDQNSVLSGYEIGNKTMVIALYGEGGKFLGVGTCEAMRWSASEYIYLAPAFDKDLLEQTVTARRLNITDALTWTPVTAVLPIE